MKSNVGLIFQREYLSRVKKKSFIYVTLLTPLGFLLFFVVAGFIFSYKSDDKTKLVISDPINMLDGKIEEARRFEFSFSDEAIDVLKKKVEDESINGIVFLTPMNDPEVTKYKYEFYTNAPLDLESSMLLDKRIKDGLRLYKMKSLNIDANLLEKLDLSVEAKINALGEQGKEFSEMTSVVSAAMGGIIGYIMFFVIVFFGTQVMRSVTEEKINRIVEVMISSVKPFELMLGKILGVSAVSFTQIGIWLILIPLIAFSVQSFFPIDPTSMTDMASEAGQEMQQLGESKFLAVMQELGNMNWWFIVPLFLYYFITGLLIYSSLFAAIGAALGDDINEGQAMVFPVMIPLILAVYIMFQVVNEPNSTLAIWSSIFPLFSCIIMPARLAYYPEWWQILASVLSTGLFAFAMIWISGRIYRVGILMYGKKASFKDMLKWIFAKV